MSNSKRVFVKFLGEDVLRENGRLVYSLLHSFLAADYAVQISTDIRQRFMERYQCAEAALPPPARLVLALEGVVFCDLPPTDSEHCIYLFDYPDQGLTRKRWRRRVKVAFDLFSPYRLRKPIIAPYCLHPVQAPRTSPNLLAPLRGASRHLRVLFAGDSNGYKKNRVRYPREKLSRLDVLTTLTAEMRDDMALVNSAAALAAIGVPEFANKFVLVETGTRIEGLHWLDVMATADFFLCAPGIVMPMCHNVIEAMAVGTIPIINYPEWLHPNLRHRENCLIFDDKADLIEKMRLALALSPPEILRMRKNVLDYFDKYLRPAAVIDEIESRAESATTLLMYTELNMAQNFARLSRNSVLMRGVNAAGSMGWITKLADRFLSVA